MEQYDICTLVSLPPEEDEPGSSHSEDCPDDVLQLGVVKSKLWPTPHVLKIKLIGGSDKVREKVKEYAKEWMRHANIKMAFIDDVTKAEIRVTFKKGGSWSMVGRDCLSRKTGPTMNFGWFNDRTPDHELARTVYHEFGHALGCVHEHQNPIGGIQWDRQKVYDYYTKNMKWDQQTIDRNIFITYSTDKTQFSSFDRDSIMLYHFPKELTLNGHFVNPNYVLSPTDIEFIGRMYPGSAPPRARRRRGTSSRQPRRSQRIARISAQKPAPQAPKSIDARSSGMSVLLANILSDRKRKPRQINSPE